MKGQQMIHIVFEEPEFNIDIFKVEIIWNNYDTGNTEMHKNMNGIWSAEINELPKGTYTYRFLINGILTLIHVRKSSILITSTFDI